MGKSKSSTNKCSGLVKACEVSQLVDFYSASMYYKKYKNSLKRASAKVSKIFEYKNFVNTAVKYRLMREFISSSSLEESLKIPFFSNLLSDPIYLLMAYSSLKDKKAGGIDDIPVANVTLVSFASLANKLKHGKYKPAPVRRIFVPKANGGSRPLGIANTQDKIIQQAIKPILEFLFEPNFSDRSHGFRKGRSCHSALHQVY